MNSSKPIPKGQIEDYISDSTQTALDLKLGINSTSDNLPQGTTNFYFTTARVLATLLTGISFVTGGSIISTDSVLIAFGKIQKQITDNVADIITKENTVNKVTTMTGNTTSNIVFLTAKAIYDWAVGKFQDILVSGTNIKSINGNSILGSGNLIVSGGEKVIYSSYPVLGLTSLNTWRTWGRSSSMVGADSNQLQGTGATPNITGATGYADSNYFLVKDCSSLSKMTLTVRENMSANVMVEIFAKSFDLVAAVGRGDENNGQVLIQEVINLGNLGTNFIKDNFTIASHTLSSNTALHFFYRITSATGVTIQGVHLKLNFT